MSKLSDFGGIGNLKSRYTIFIKTKTHKYIILIVKSQPQSRNMAIASSSWVARS